MKIFTKPFQCLHKTKPNFFAQKTTTLFLLFLLVVIQNTNGQNDDPSISGQFEVCGNKDLFYTILNPPNNASYKWTIDSTSLGRITTQDDIQTITVHWISNTTNDDKSTSLKCQVSFNTLDRTISIKPNTTITNTIDNVAMFTNDTTSIEVTANGSSLTYQWQVSNDNGVNFNDIPSNDNDIYTGETTNNLTITNPSKDFNNYQYHCSVLGDCDTLASNNSTLSVFQAPTIAIDSTLYHTCSGIDKTLSVTASGEDTLTFQWKIKNGSSYDDLPDGDNYTGTTNDSLKIINTPANFNGNTYACFVTSTPTDTLTQTVQSSDATLTVYPTPEFAEGASITMENVLLCPGSEVKFSAPRLDDVTYSWTVPEGWSITDGQGTEDAKIEIGTATGTLKVTAKSTHDCGYASLETLISPLTTTSINTQPSPVINANADGIASISVEATGSNLQYQWQVQNENQDWNNLTDQNLEPFYEGSKTDILKFSKVYPNYNDLQYRCLVKGECGNATSTSTTLKQETDFTPTINTDKNPICSGETCILRYSLPVVTDLTFDYQWKKDGNEIGSYSSTLETTPTNTSNYTLTLSHGNFSISSSTFTLYVNKKPDLELFSEPDTIYKNQKGVFFSANYNRNDSIIWAMSLENITAFSDINKPYFIVNFGNSESVDFAVTVTDTSTNCVNQLKSTLTINVTSGRELPEKLVWRQKGDYLLLFDTNDMIQNLEYTWGKKSLNTYKDTEFAESNELNYHDFYPEAIQSDINLYWVQCNVNGKSRYYYNIPMTIVEKEPNIKQNTNLEIYPNPVKDKCFINPSSVDLTYPCTVSYYDLHGQKVHRIRISDQTETPFADDISRLHQGLYVVLLTDQTGRSLSTKLLLNK